MLSGLLGLYSEAEFGERTIGLQHGDRVLLYTDGLFDISDGGPPAVETIAQTLRTIAPHRRVLEQVLAAVSGGREREDRDDVTMLLLDAETNNIRYQQTEPQVEQVELKVEPAVQPPEITIAQDAGRSFLCLSGRVTWANAETLLSAAAEQIKANHGLVLDLSGCTYLDSTMLGTLHEIVRRAGEAQVPVSLHNVSPAIAAAFAEVSMETVLTHIENEPAAIPDDRKPLQIPQTDLRRQRTRLLRAHEELAALSPKNEAEFGSVIKALRQETEDS